MNIKQIKLNNANPRQIKDTAFKKLCKSVKEFPKMLALRPIVVDRDGTILGGNMRYRALLSLGYKEIPDEWVRYADTLTDEEKRRFIIEDNVEFGEWDIEALANEWDTDDLSDWGVEVPDLERSALQEAEEDDFNEEEVTESVCRNGDVWQLGDHRLMCGDSTSENDVALLMDGNKADLLLTDPPYNVDYEGSDGQKIKNDKMGDSAFLNFLTDAFTAANNVLRPGCAIYIWHADSEGYNFRSAFKAAGWTLRQCLIWVKNSLVLGRQDYQWKHEPCLYGWKDGAAHYFTNSRSETTTIEDEGLDFEKMKKNQRVQLLKDIYSDKVETTVIHENKPARNAEHPTMKPIRLLARLIRNSSRQGQNVLDTFGGSGSTLIACEQMNRTCYTMELDPHYCDVIIARWEKLTRKKAVKISNHKEDYEKSKGHSTEGEV